MILSVLHRPQKPFLFGSPRMSSSAQIVFLRKVSEAGLEESLEILQCLWKIPDKKLKTAFDLHALLTLFQIGRSQNQNLYELCCYDGTRRNEEDKEKAQICYCSSNRFHPSPALGFTSHVPFFATDGLKVLFWVCHLVRQCLLWLRPKTVSQSWPVQITYFCVFLSFHKLWPLALTASKEEVPERWA